MPENTQQVLDESIEEDKEIQKTTAVHDKSNESSDDDPPHCDQEEENVETVEMKLSQKKALLQLRSKVEEAILGNSLLKKAATKDESTPERVDLTLWGMPLVPSKGDEGTDIVLMKFLKAGDFRVSEAFEMLWNTVRWREDNKIDDVLDEEFSPDLEKLVILNGTDMEGRPLCYHVYGAFRDKELYKKTFGTKQKCDEYLRLTAKIMESCIPKLSFKEGGVNSIVHIADLKNLHKSSMRELRSVLRSTFVMLQDNYPELIHKFVMINVPFWYYTSHVLLTRVLHPSSKRKFVFARPSKVPKTLLKFVSPKDLPIQYGGLKRENDNEFLLTDDISELIVRKNSTGSIQIPIPEGGVTIAWDLTVVGWDVTYKEEFIPDDECSYTILIRNAKQRFEEGVRNSFYINEPGKIVISIDNTSYKKKRVLYRTKSKPTAPTYIFFK